MSNAADWRRKAPSDIRVRVVVPVLNEAHVLETKIRTLHHYLSTEIPYAWEIVIAENGSVDGTVEAAARLSLALSRVRLLIIGQRGRGRALRAAWSEGGADILCYTDVDLSTELEAFPRLFDALIHGGYDLAVGSRLARGSKTTRSLKREVISRGYNLILKATLQVGFSDAQTGFKAVTREVVERVLPYVHDQAWFLDTELLVLAERLGYRIADLPVRWTEDDDSRVKIVSTAWEDLKGIARVRRALTAGLTVTAATPAPLRPAALTLGPLATSGGAAPKR